MYEVCIWWINYYKNNNKVDSMSIIEIDSVKYEYSFVAVVE